jgi:hypothetical protein
VSLASTVGDLWRPREKRGQSDRLGMAVQHVGPHKIGSACLPELSGQWQCPDIGRRAWPVRFTDYLERISMRIVGSGAATQRRARPPPLQITGRQAKKAGDQLTSTKGSCVCCTHTQLSSVVVATT